jgi:hypothetical protein
MADDLPMTFVDLIALQALNSKTSEQGAEKFMSLNPAFNLGGGAAYGGHV